MEVTALPHFQARMQARSRPESSCLAAPMTRIPPACGSAMGVCPQRRPQRRDTNQATRQNRLPCLGLVRLTSGNARHAVPQRRGAMWRPLRSLSVQGRRPYGRRPIRRTLVRVLPVRRFRTVAIVRTGLTGGTHGEFAGWRAQPRNPRHLTSAWECSTRRLRPMPATPVMVTDGDCKVDMVRANSRRSARAHG
jgi:hypothetical protein